MAIEYRALLILAFMIVGFLLNKWPRGLTTMTCCLLFCITGVLDLKTSFSGITNTTVLMIAGLFPAINAMQRTRAMVKLKGIVGMLANKSGLTLLLGFMAILAVFAQFFGTTAGVPLLLSFLCTLPEGDDISVSRLAIPVAGLCAMWQYTFPFGMSLALPMELNSYYEAMISDSSQLITLFDLMKLKMLPCILVTVWTLFAYKLMPNVQANIALAAKGGKEAEQLPTWKEWVIYIVMVADMVCLFLGSKIGQWMYLVPLIGLFVLAYSKAVPVPTIVKDITSDTIWMIAGILVMSTALNSSGAGQLLGETILGLLGENPSKVVALLIFGGATGIMTNLMSNIASRAVVTPIAAVTAISAGWNPVPFVLTVSQMAWCAVVLPSASSAAALGHATSNQQLKDSLKYTIPFFILALGGCIISALLFF